MEVWTGKICLEAEVFWKNELEMQKNLEASNSTSNWKRINSKSEDANSEKWPFKRSWKRRH